jgi:hypothetical protein
LPIVSRIISIVTSLLTGSLIIISIVSSGVCSKTCRNLLENLPGSAFKAHLAPKGSPTALIKIVGDPVPAVAIENLLARICHLSSQWKWEAIPHGSDAFLVGFPSAEDLSRMDGMQMGIPSSTSQMSITSWQIQDVPHKLELQMVCVGGMTPGMPKAYQTGWFEPSRYWFNVYTEA